MPWLLDCMSRGDDGVIRVPCALDYCKLGSSQIRTIHGYEEQICTRIYGPGHGHLLVVRPNDDLDLINPLTRNTIPLPRLDQNLRIHSLAFSGSVPTQNWCVVSRRGSSSGPWVCVVYHRERRAWTYVEMDTCLQDECSACCLNEKLFGTAKKCLTGVYDTISGEKLYEVTPPNHEKEGDIVSCFLIESSCDILKVYVYKPDDVGFNDGQEGYNVGSDDGEGGSDVGSDDVGYDDEEEGSEVGSEDEEEGSEVGSDDGEGGSDVGSDDGEVVMEIQYRMYKLCSGEGEGGGTRHQEEESLQL